MRLLKNLLALFVQQIIYFLHHILCSEGIYVSIAHLRLRDHPYLCKAKSKYLISSSQKCDDPRKKGMFEDVDVKFQAHFCLKFDVNVFEHALFPWIVTNIRSDRRTFSEKTMSD